MEVEPGVFTIVDIVYPEAGEQVERTIEEKQSDKVLLLSGLKFTHGENIDNVSVAQLLKEYLMGELSFSDEDIKLLKSITNIIILGNSTDVSLTNTANVKEKDKYREQNKSVFDAESMRQFDEFLSQLLKSIPVTILPGNSDPAETSLPKQPLHKSLFIKSSQSTNFQRASNPCWLDIDDSRLLCTSGENIDDIYKYMVPNLAVELGDSEVESSIQHEVLYKSRLKLLEGTMKWQHILPTAPDTLWCYPFENDDPFALKETPHVYAVGNQPKFETSCLKLNRKNGEEVAVRIIAVPEFCKTHEGVLLDMESLECSVMKVGL
ncbi:unnamed protein product [Ambrosiozyma monospora]|uniref:Unnamed protein product n=1 Tax=Ambrosiozyma monospora TaxID=43982 RepID=A0ACB5SX04_AMBMO|nr:unnamed protein product [Ambrosiozyma monospora]